VPTLLRLAQALSLGSLLAGCGTAPAPTVQPSLADEAGFLAIEPITLGFSTATGLPAAVTTPEARIFYSFQPAAEAPLDKPLFVFFNGGPGFATSLGLLAFNTAARTLDARFSDGRSPRPWTELGNLLYLDPRETGFSYDLGTPGDHPDERAAGFAPAVFNPLTDGADLVRAVLRFLGEHPALRASPVILVGESYGGTRAAAMLNLVHHPERYEDPTSFVRDVALGAEVRAHFAATHPGAPFTPELAAAQFGRQILIEPAVAGQLQIDAGDAAFGRPGSTLQQVAAAHGIDCPQCADGDPECSQAATGQACRMAITTAGLDISDLQQTLDEGNAILAAAQARLRSVAGLGALLGVDPAGIEGLGAGARAGAYRTGAETPTMDPLPDNFGPEAMAAELGALPAWDHYFVGLNQPIITASMDSGLGWTQSFWGAVFLDNVQRVETFVTSAGYDAIIHSDSLAEALRGVPGVSAAALDRSPREGEPRPGVLTVEYAAPGGGASQTLRIRMPHYASSGHAVAMRQPEDLADDVAAWLGAAR
jgi:hypothetical protein